MEIKFANGSSIKAIEAAENVKSEKRDVIWLCKLLGIKLFPFQEKLLNSMFSGKTWYLGFRSW